MYVHFRVHIYWVGTFVMPAKFPMRKRLRQNTLYFLKYKSSYKNMVEEKKSETALPECELYTKVEYWW